MLKLSPFPMIVTLLFAPAAFADSVKTKCPDLEKCANAVAELTGSKYVFDGAMLKGPVQATANFEMTKENAEEVFTQMLDQNGFTRLPLSEPNTFTILRERDGRDSALPEITADSKTTPAIPKAWDLATLRYRLSQPELAEHLARNIRSFMPGNSRVIPDPISGQLIFVAPYPILANVLRLVQSMDVKVSTEKLKKLDEELRLNREAARQH
jgi:type II secretory pathway component GspD/PulD (secretin)